MTAELNVEALHDPGQDRDGLSDALLRENARLQKQLNQQRQRTELFEGVFHSLSDALLIANQHRVVEVCNPAVETVFGYVADEIVGCTAEVLYDDKTEFEAKGRERFNISAEQQATPYNVHYRHKDGQTFIGETVGTPVRGHDGKLLGFLGAIRDVTVREEKKTAIYENEKLLRLIANSIPELVVYVDRNSIIRFVNATGEQWYNASKDDLVGKHIDDVLGPQAATVLRPLYERAFRGENVKRRSEVTYPDGQTRHVEVSYVPDVDCDGSVNGFVALVVDISRQHAIECRMRAAQTRFADAIEAIPDAFAYYDADDKLRIFNSQYNAMFAISGDSIAVGNSFEDILRAGLAQGQYQDAVGCEEEWINERLARHHNPGTPIEQKLGNGRWIRIEERKTRDGGTVGVRVDITELKQREEELQRLSTTDHLTNLANRRAYLNELDTAHRAANRRDSGLSLLLIDVDEFKAINDTHGHAAGDTVLKDIAGIITGELRGEDRACRYGGEEFAAFLPDTSLGGAFATAERIRAAIAKRRIIHNDAVIRATVSIGVAQLDERDGHHEDALARADAALYEAKEAGRNRVKLKAHPAL